MAGGHWKIRWGGTGRAAGAAAGRGLGGRLVASLFFLFFFGLGSFFVALIARETWRAVETYLWAGGACEILRSEVVRAAGGDPYRPEVAFRTLDGAVEGRRIERRKLSYGSHGEAAERLEPYPVGATVPCYVSQSGEAVLERGPLWTSLWLLLPLVFVAIGGSGLVAIWWPKRRDRLGRPVLEPLADAAKRPGRALVAFGLVFAAIGTVVFWFSGVVPIARMLDARGWQAQRCTVEHSSVVSHESDDGTTYSVDILYRWDRGRGVERSSRYSFFGGSSSGYDGKAEIVRAHPEGAEVACWVDPEQRNQAVLVRTFTPMALVGTIPLAFVVAGCALVVAGRRHTARRSRMRSRAYAGALPFAPEDPILDVLPAFALRPGPERLEAQSSRWGRVAGIAFVTLFWNGIVSVFLGEAWKGWERANPDYFLTLFLVPFVLVGIALFFGVLHALLALRNPRPTLLVSSSTPRLGDRIDLQWSFRGGVHRLSSVRIALKGVEQATYQVGTDTRTASEDFFERVVVDVSAPMCHAGGHVSVEIPGASIHSFESGHNKFLWQLELKGEIPRWPDATGTYPLVVLPRMDDRKPEDR